MLSSIQTLYPAIQRIVFFFIICSVSFRHLKIGSYFDVPFFGLDTALSTRWINLRHNLQTCLGNVFSMNGAYWPYKKGFLVTIWTLLVSGLTHMINQTTMPRCHEPRCKFPFLFVYQTSVYDVHLDLMPCTDLYFLFYLNSVIDSWARKVPHMRNVEWIYSLAQRYPWLWNTQRNIRQ